MGWVSAAPASFIYLCIYSSHALINYTIAKISEPNAKDPKWYMNALFTEVKTGENTEWPPFYEKYQMATALA